MKKMLRAIILATVIVPMFIIMAKAEKVEAVILSSDGYGASGNLDVDLSGWDRVSIQANYFTNPASAITILSGLQSSATLTVSNYASLCAIGCPIITSSWKIIICYFYRV